jgi:SEC-C motif-containing protein
MPFAAPADADRCPCLSGETYGQCCAPIHRGEHGAPTAERLMRSRYSAFVVGDVEYLLRSWHPQTRPASLSLDPEVRWFRLDIVATRQGGPLDSVGIVEFRAFYRSPDGRGEQHEVSRFARDGRSWTYLGEA